MPYSHLTGAVIGGSEPLSEHDVEMIQKDVPVRIGDDAVQVDLVDDQSTEEHDEEGRMEITMDTETGEVDGLEEEEADEQGDESTEDDLPEFHKVDPKTMTEAAELMLDAQTGQEELITQAIEKGLDTDLVDEMRDYYMENGKLSKAHYAELSKIGYTQSFIDSYIKGQDAVAEKFARSVMEYCGGAENYNKVTAFMSAKQTHMVDAFNGAIERGDVATMRALLDATKTAMGSDAKAPKHKAPKRNLAAAAKSKPVASTVQVEGYKSRAEMVKDMSNPQYAKDPAFRRQVELKVLNASF